MAEGSDAPETPQKQKQIECSKIKELIDLPLVKGELWYLLDAHWFNQWKKYVSWDQWEVCNSDDSSSYPGCIDNSLLFEFHSKSTSSTPINSLELKANLTEGLGWI